MILFFKLCFLLLFLMFLCYFTKQPYKNTREVKFTVIKKEKYCNYQIHSNRLGNFFSSFCSNEAILNEGMCQKRQPSSVILKKLLSQYTKFNNKYYRLRSYFPFYHSKPEFYNRMNKKIENKTKAPLIKSSINQCLQTIKKALSFKVLKKAKRTVIHVRTEDQMHPKYVKPKYLLRPLGTWYELPKFEYYKKALTLLPKTDEIIIMSRPTHACASNYLLRLKAYVKKICNCTVKLRLKYGSDDDFMFIINSSGIITGISTFSWWAALLSGSNVVVPTNHDVIGAKQDFYNKYNFKVQTLKVNSTYFFNISEIWSNLQMNDIANCKLYN